MTTLSPPVSPQPAEVHRPRAVSAMSHASTGRRSSKSSNKLEMVESPRDKKKFSSEGHADPLRALNEATPGEIAQQQSNLDDLRLMQWKDQEGNVINDPDRSNPTRPRLERPLDTIRGFNAAAEGTANRRSSSYGGRPTSQYGSEAGYSRPGSYYGSSGYGGQRGYSNYNRQTPGGGYYRNNSYGFGGQQNASFDENAEYQYQDHYRPQPPRPGPSMRNMNGSNPYHGSHPAESPMSMNSQQHSYETMTSGSDENGKSTNPSSLNSSYDQLHMAHPHMRKQENYSQPPPNQYENEMKFAPVSPVSAPIPQYGHGANGRNNGEYYGNGNGAGGYQQPPVPPKNHHGSGGRQPMNLNGPPSAPSSGLSNGGGTLKKTESAGKRQSWLSRKFSRREK